MKHDIEADFPAWYQEVIAKAKLAESGPVRGTFVIRPYGYRIWELMQSEMDARIKAAGAENAYFPLLIPESYLAREAEHVEGFSPELAVVTHAGGAALEEPLVVRPTSETVIGEYMAKWIQSYRDLPLLLNQWANVVRWEKRPRAFLRTTEFLWQEGHTAHATRSDAATYARRILDEVYAPFMSDFLAVPVVRGQKPPSERFAGAINTMTCEAMMGDGKALQMGTSHELGTNFAEAFGIRYLSSTGQQETAWTTSWGSSTRMLGGLFMTHGDARGLRLPPTVAPHQVVIVQIGPEAELAEAVDALAARLISIGVRVHIDRDFSRSVGARFTDWELMGVPVRVDYGVKELASGKVAITERHTGEKQQGSVDWFVASIDSIMRNIQDSLLNEALRRLGDRTTDAGTPLEAREAAQAGFGRIPWSALAHGGEAVLRDAAVTVRCITTPTGEVPDGPPGADDFAIVARSY